MNSSQCKCKQFLQTCLKKPVSNELHMLFLLFSFLLPEIGLYISITPTPKSISLIFGVLYALLLTGICLILPKVIGIICFAVNNFVLTAWAMSQLVYFYLFHRLMWTNDVAYASDSVIFIDDVLNFYAPLLWWVLVGIWFLLYVSVLFRWPLRNTLSQYRKCKWLGTICTLLALCILENSALTTRSDITQGTLPVYYNNGFYHLLKEDVKLNWLDPYLPNYEQRIEEQHNQIDVYFSKRPEHLANQMTGAFKGKNVIVVLMESLDDWMITPD